MTPGTLVLLHAPRATAASWGDMPEMLRSYGLDVIAPDVPDSAGARYVARASLIIAATDPVAPLVLIALGGAGPLLPGLSLAQRAAHRKIGGYVFVDADLPRPERAQDHDHDGPGPGGPGTGPGGHGTGPGGHDADGDGDGGGERDPDHGAVPMPPDWPEAPCGYLRTHADRTDGPAERERTVREARLRGWVVVEHEPPAAAAQALSELIATL